jgi:maltose O-acetyltransferase
VRDRSRAALEQGRRSAGITVGAGAWIGAGATVLDGVAIGDRAIVGAGAVVRNDVPEGATAVGIPARLLDR